MRIRDHGIAALAALALGLFAGGAPAQIPDKFTNLKVLPPSVTKDQLLEIMRGFTQALGVRCVHCHVGEPGKPLSTFDFPSDAKLPKQAARVMLLMVQEINLKYIRQVKSDRPEHTPVNCMTCHHGIVVPRTIQMELQSVRVSKGLDAAIQDYRALREKYFGTAACDFSEAPLDEYAVQLAAARKIQDAMRLLELNAEYHPKSAAVAMAMGDVLAKSGDRQKAIEKYKEALAIDPENEGAKRRLEELEKEAPAK